VNASPLWTPSAARIGAANMTRFMEFAAQRHGARAADYGALLDWSVSDLGAFWTAVWDFCGVKAETRGSRALVDGGKMPGARFFPDARLNFAENLLRRNDDGDALVFWGEDKVRRRMSWRQLAAEVSRLQQAFRAEGLRAGDRVAAYMPNMPETIVAMLAATSLGGVFTSCSPDFGVQGVVDRFGQVEPKVLVCCDGYFYNGKVVETLPRLAEIVALLPTVERVVVVPYASQAPDAAIVPRAVTLADFVAPFAPAPLRFERLPFNHPLYILYSSGTTGVPKCIVHGAGGALIQHLKEHVLHADVKREDKLFYYTTCGWMMWNWAVSTLQAGATLYTFDGSPFHPSPEALWRIADEERLQIFGASAKYLGSCRTAGVAVERFALEKLRSVLSTGSALLPEDFDWVHAHVRPARPIQLASISGGTDIVSCFMLGTPLKPVRRNEIQARGLGMAVAAFDETGRPVFGEQGELVCTKPFPSMPVSFWNDANDEKYHQAYFARFPGVWHHGDFVTITPEGGVTIHGRSDATLNPGGVRIGTAEVYRYVETHPSVADSLVVGQAHEGDERIVLFVKMRPGAEFNEGFVADLKRRIREGASPRHVPAVVAAVGDIPYTRSGKKVEMAVKSLLRGEEPKNLEALANPEALEAYRRWRNT